MDASSTFLNPRFKPTVFFEISDMYSIANKIRPDVETGAFLNVAGLYSYQPHANGRERLCAPTPNREAIMPNSTELIHDCSDLTIEQMRQTIYKHVVLFRGGAVAQNALGMKQD
jgi:hypothetical protein